MIIDKNEQLLDKAVHELGLAEKFEISRVRPVLCRCEKGELLSGPHIRPRYLLFLYSGILQIYGVGIDGRKIPVNLAKKGSVIGDVEFCSRKSSNLYSEVAKEALCVGIRITEYRDVLENDNRFLKYLLSSISQKVYLTSFTDTPAVSVEEKLLEYMKTECPDNVLKGVEHATLALRCSRRQLQRVLKELCETGQIRKEAKGTYRLV